MRISAVSQCFGSCLSSFVAREELSMTALPTAIMALLCGCELELERTTTYSFFVVANADGSYTVKISVCALRRVRVAPKISVCALIWVRITQVLQYVREHSDACALLHTLHHALFLPYFPQAFRTVCTTLRRMFRAVAGIELCFFLVGKR